MKKSKRTIHSKKAKNIFSRNKVLFTFGAIIVLAVLVILAVTFMPQETLSGQAVKVAGVSELNRCNADSACRVAYSKCILSNHCGSRDTNCRNNCLSTSLGKIKCVPVAPTCVNTGVSCPGNSVVPKVICAAGQICQNGACVKPVCSSNDDCLGLNQCIYGVNIFTNNQSICTNPGTAQAACGGGVSGAYICNFGCKGNKCAEPTEDIKEAISKATCVPNCTNFLGQPKQCGPNGCGGTCGTCNISNHMFCGLYDNLCLQSNNQEVCFDGVDNNGDGKIDCADPLCDGSMLFAQVNTSQGLDIMDVECQYQKERSCSDGFDNDWDGKIDQADPDCNS